MAWAAHLSHEAEIKANEPFTTRLFQLHLHDKLTRDVHRLMAPEPQHKSALPTYGLVINNDSLDQLSKRLPPDDGQPYYVDAELVKGSRVYSVQVRYRGGKYWHYNHPQKSWKVRVKDGKVVEGFNTFNFINTPEAVPFEEEIILDVARDLGLLTPEYFPFRLLINKVYNGVHFFESQPDEGMLRHALRPPGTIYSGSDSPIDPATGISSLFKSADNFTKVTQGIHQKLGERAELEALITAINQSSPQEFARYAESHLDVDRFAQWDALDVVFGCNQHDFSENHKLYFDPYRDRFEPIAWNFRGCKHDLELNRTENPLILRLKQLPSYLSRRNRIVYQLLQSTASTASLRERTTRLLDKLHEDQARDPYWDAFQLLPAVSPYYSSLLRPVDRRQQGLAIESRLYEMEERKAYLTQLLERNGCGLSLTGADAELLSSIDVTVGGHAGYSIERIEPSWPADCVANTWRLFADSTLDGTLQLDQDREVGVEKGPLGIDLQPGAVMQKRGLQVHRGKVRMASEPRQYRFFVKSTSCAPIAVKLRLKNLVSQAMFELSAGAKIDGDHASILPTHCNDTYAEEPGHSSPHPWCYGRLQQQAISLGPGVIDIDQTQIYRSDKTVEIAPGTTLRLAPNASLIFMGKVLARGSESSPVRFEPKAGNWGGIAIQGPGATGSVLEYVQFRGGTQPVSSTIPWPGFVNLNDTSDVRLDHCQIVPGAEARVAVQIGESKNIVVSQSTIRGGHHSVQVQYSNALVEASTIIGSAGDAINIAASQVEVRSCKMLSYAGDGISVSRRGDVRIEDVALIRGNRGLRIHEASQVQYERVLLFENRECIGFDASSDTYSRKAHLGGSELFEIGCKDTLEKGGRYAKSLGQVAAKLGLEDLSKLRSEVIGISDWSQLGARVDNLTTGGAL